MSNGEMPTVFVIFGATGDLIRRRVAPALFKLYRKKMLPPLFQIVGFSRQELSDGAFREEVKKMLRNKGSDDEVEGFSNLFVYRQGFFDQLPGYQKLAEYLGFKDKEWRTCSNKLFYLAVPPQYYKTIFTNLAESRLTEPCSPEEGWTRVIVEKPFGKDLKTAEELDLMLGKLFREEQIYRIDHYLGKETVQNILAFRFSNSFLEPNWNKNFIERISVKLLEPEGVESRGDFYDGLGALRDVGQNHVLQLLALLTMENPGNFNADAIREKRADVLRSLEIPNEEQVKRQTIRGQYEGYKSIEGVSPSSKIETYFRIKTFLNTPRWNGVPIYLESGKKIGETEKTEISVVFKHHEPCLCPPNTHYRNILRYTIEPKESIRMSFWVKKPGAELTLEEKDFSFDYKSVYAEELFLDPYEKLCLDAILGNQTLFVSTKEILASWRFADAITSAWEAEAAPLQVYTPGTLRVAEFDESVPERINKEVGFIGLGKMGRNMVLRLLERGWNVSGFDKETDHEELKARGARIADSLVEMVSTGSKPRLLWLMTPAKAVDEVLDGLNPFLKEGDIVVDGGNSFYEDSMQRAERLKKLGVYFVDVGVSGGPSGAKNGTALMIGGEREVFERLEPLFRDLAVPGGYAYMGESGAGHFVKMVHNGIEYGMMQAIAEGFSVLRAAEFRGDEDKYGAGKLNLAEVADMYNRGSVIESRLIGWLKKAFDTYGEDLRDVSGSVAHTGEGEWTVKTAKKLGIPVKIIEDAFQFRVDSAKDPSFIGKVLSALRNQFGGHSIH